MEPAGRAMKPSPHLDPPAFLRSLFQVAVQAADPLVCLPPVLPPPSTGGQTCVIALGKAAAGMALAARNTLGADLSGLVVVRHGLAVDHAALGPRFEVIHAAHPVPDEQSERAGRRAMELAASLGEGDRMLALVSGGGSALAEVPLPGLTLADLRELTAALLASGAPIGEINTVRRSLSAFKGGGLAEAAGKAEVITCLISDVPGDSPGEIASGPTIADDSNDEAVSAILERYRIDVSVNIRTVMQNTRRSPVQIRVDPWPRLAASGSTALAAATHFARNHDVEVLNLGDGLAGEAQVLAREHARMAIDGARGRPLVILSGGETTVISGPETARQGSGGRNLEYLLALAIALDGAPGVHAIACDTDGLDGTSPAAGALISPTTLDSARKRSLDPHARLAAHDSHGFFEALGDLVMTGQTGTNVNDFRAIFVC